MSGDLYQTNFRFVEIWWWRTIYVIKHQPKIKYLTHKFKNPWMNFSYLEVIQQKYPYFLLDNTGKSWIIEKKHPSGKFNIFIGSVFIIDSRITTSTNFPSSHGIHVDINKSKETHPYFIITYSSWTPIHFTGNGNRVITPGVGSILFSQESFIKIREEAAHSFWNLLRKLSQILHVEWIREIPLTQPRQSIFGNTRSHST